MAIGSGMSAQLGVALETTAGVPVTPTAFVPFVSEKLKADRKRVESKGIIAGRRLLDSNMWNGGTIDVGGDVGLELYNRGLGKWFTGMFGTVTSTTGPVGSLYTHTWTGLSAPQPLTVQKGVTGVSGTTIPLTYTGSMVESWELRAKVDEIVTLGVTLSSMQEYGFRTVSDGATTNSSPTITSATAVWTQDDVGSPITGTGIPASTTILSVQSSTAATLSANATATGSSVTFSIGVPLASASYPSTPSLKPFKYNHASVTFAGSSLPVTDLTLSGKNGLATDRYFLGRRTRSVPVEAGLHEITGTANIEFTDRTMYDRFRAESTYAFVLSISNGTESVTVTTNVRVDGETPMVGDTGIVPQSVPFKVTNTTDASAWSVVVVSADSTP